MYFSSKELFIREKSLKCIRNSFFVIQFTDMQKD